MVYNLFILPIRFFILIYFFFSDKKHLSFSKFKIICLKIVIFFIGLYISNKIEESKTIIYFYNLLDNLKGLKVFTLQKVIEFICILMNRCFREFDIQILSILYEKKFKKQLFTFIFIIGSLFIYIISTLSYIFCVRSTLNDPKKSIYPLLFKINYIELKKCGKPIKKKNLMSQLNTDIFDRFFNFFVLFNVLITDYSTNQINNVKFYFTRFFYLFFFEIIFDYIKDIIVFRISYFDSKILKYISYEIPLYYIKLKENLLTKDEEFLKDKKLLIIGRQYKYDKFSSILSSDDIMCLTLQNGILIYCILIINSIFKKCKLNNIIFFIILISCEILREIICKGLLIYVKNFEEKHRKKMNEKSFKEELELYVNLQNNNKINQILKDFSSEQIQTNSKDTTNKHTKK